MNLFLELLGLVFIYCAVYYGRGEESKIDFLKTSWWITTGLVTMGYLILINL